MKYLTSKAILKVLNNVTVRNGHANYILYIALILKNTKLFLFLCLLNENLFLHFFFTLLLFFFTYGEFDVVFSFLPIYDVLFYE